jgi:hypothetical protein
MKTETKTPQLTPQAVVEAYEKYKAGRRSGGTLAMSNWPTTLAHDCRAYAVYMRTVPPEQRRQIGADLAMIFSEGNDQARMVKRDLEDAGFIVSDQESQMAWPAYQISGRKDLKIWKEGFREKINVEVKSCSPFTFDKINKPEDIAEAEQDWLRKWYKQLALYMVLQGVDRYWLLLKSKTKGSIKILEFTMDDKIYQTAEAMIQKAEWVNNLIQIRQMPKESDKIADADYCSECEFYDVCLPDLSFGPGAVIFDEESVGDLAAQLERRAELEPAFREYKALDDDLKSEMKSHASEGQEKLVVGDWIVSIKDVPKKAYSVPAHTERHVKFFKP